MLLAACTTAKAWSPSKLLHNYSYYARAAYNLGGTAPIGMPATIRKMNSYSLRPNFTLGIDAFHPFNDKWGIMFGLHFENKGMKVDATVKNYHMKMVQGGESIEGMFTGRVMTKVDQSLGTIPVQATYDISDKVRLKLGPYFSYVTSHDFSGYAYDGYLREGDPTGPKVELGNDASPEVTSTSLVICATGSLALQQVPTGISVNAGQLVLDSLGDSPRFSRRTSTSSSRACTLSMVKSASFTS